MAAGAGAGAAAPLSRCCPGRQSPSAAAMRCRSCTVPAAVVGSGRGQPSLTRSCAMRSRACSALAVLVGCPHASSETILRASKNCGKLSVSRAGRCCCWPPAPPPPVVVAAPPPYGKDLALASQAAAEVGPLTMCRCAALEPRVAAAATGGLCAAELRLGTWSPLPRVSEDATPPMRLRCNVSLGASWAFGGRSWMPAAGTGV